MPACQGLIRKDGALYFQARVPEECLALWRARTGKKGPIHRERLDTRDWVEARRIVLATKWPEFTRMCDGLANRPPSEPDFSPRTSITAAESERLAAAVLHSMLAADESIRLDELTDTQPTELRDWHKAAALRAVRANAARGEVNGYLSDIIHDWLQADNYDIDRSSPEFRMLARGVARAVAKALKKAEQRDAGEFVDTPSPPPSRGPTFEDCFEAWKRRSSRPPKTVRDAEGYIKSFVAAVGTPYVLEVQRRDVIQWRDSLAKSDGSALHPKSINKRLTMLGAVFNVGAKDEVGGLPHSTPSPFKGTALPEPKGARPVTPFGTTNLTALFASPVYAGNYRPEGGRGQAAYWLPVLALFTGARLEELAQLRLGDIGEEDGIRFIHITPEAGRVKTSTERRVPLHSALEALGFLRYVEHIRVSGADRLFPLLAVSESTGSRSDSWSKWFGRYRCGEVGIKDPRVVFHSLRHSFVDACGVGHVRYDLTERLVGHEVQGEGGNYGAQLFPLEPLKDAIERVRYPGVALPAPWKPCPDVVPIPQTRRKRTS
jgi:site-specific recombinase XerD